MNKEQMRELAQRQLEAYNSRDLKKFCECYHPEVKVTHLIGNQVRCEGIEAFRTLYRTLFETNPRLHCELKSRMILDSSVVDEEWVTGVAHAPEGLHVVAIYGFREGRIDRVWFPR